MEVELEELVDDKGRRASEAPPPPPPPKPKSVAPPPKPKSAAPPPVPEDVASTMPRGPVRGGPGETTMDHLLTELEGELQVVVSPAPMRERTPSGRPPPPPPPAAPTGFRVPDPRAPRSRVRTDGPVAAAAAVAAPAADPAAEPGVDPFAQDASALIRSCEEELGKNPPALKAARLHFEIARLYESPLRDLRRAAAHYQEALQRAPEHIPTIRGARRLLIARKGFQAALPLFDSEARITADPRRKAGLFLAKGRLLEDVLGSKDEAIKCYRTALELDRSDASILKAIEQYELDHEEWDALARTYERAANAVSADPRHRAALIVQRARLLESRRQDVDAAIELYETALKLDPRAHGAVSALKRLHHTHRRWRDLIRVLEREAKYTSDESVRTMALYRIGRLHAERLGNNKEALAALERALEVSPLDPLVLGELARLYEAVERWPSMLEVLRRLADSSVEGEERIGLLHRIGELCEQRLLDEQAAIQWYEETLRLRPTYVPALQALGKLYTAHSDWAALVRMHLAEAEAGDDAKRRAVAHARTAEILETHLNKPDEAADHHAKALGLVPGYPPSFKALSRLLADANRWRELVELYERAVDLAGGQDLEITYLLKIGAIYDDRLGEPEQAAHTYRRVLGVDADHLGAIHALQQALERAGRWPQLVEALALEAEKSKDKNQIVALQHRAGDILLDHVGDRDAAMLRFREALRQDPRYVPALISVGRVYYMAGRWEDLLDTYKRELELTPRGPTAVALLHKMAALSEERIGNEEEALGYYRRAIEIDPTYAPALRALTAKLREKADWAGLVRTLELELNGLSDPLAKARAAYRIGEVYEEHLDQAERAIKSYEQALKVVSGYRPAIDALSRMRAERKAWSHLVDDLEHEATESPDPGLAVSALMREGIIWTTHLGEPRRAIACFERVLEREPRHVGALLALEPLYRRVGSWAQLSSTYYLLAELFSDVGARVAVLRELARLQETRSPAVEGDVLATYEAIVALVPDDPAALEAIERVALERGDRGLLTRIDTILAASAEDPAVKASYQTRLAESLEVAGADGAIDAYRMALATDPEGMAATRGLSRLAERTNDPVALAEAARREASVASDTEVAARLLVRSATVRAERLGDLEGAQADLERAMELWPDHTEAAERLTAILSNGGSHARLADLLARAAGSAKSPERVAALWMDVARLQAERLDNVAGAISALNRVLRSTPNHVATLRMLADLYVRDGQWTEAVNLLSRVVQLAPDRVVLRNAHLQLAAVWAERLGETSRALVSLQAVLALDSDNREALARLSALQETEGKLDQAAETVMRLIKVSSDPRDRAAGMVRLARIEHSRGNGEASMGALLEAVALDGPGSEAALELKTVLSTPREWDRYADSLSRYLDSAAIQGTNTAPVYLEISRIRHDNLQQPNAAIEVLERALDTTGQAPEIEMELATRLRSAGRFADALERLHSLLEGDLTQSEAWRDLARTYEAMQRPGEVRLALMPLVVLGAATDNELEYLHRHPPRPAHARPASMGPDVVGQLLPSGAPEAAAAELLRTLTEGLSKIFPPDLEAYGLSPRDRVTAKQDHPLRNLADSIGRVVGAGDFDLYVHRVRTRGVALELGAPPALLLPASVTDLPMSQQVFLLARPLVCIALQLHSIEKLTPRELEVLLASAARNVSSGYGAGLTAEEFLTTQAKRIQKSLSRRTRKLMEESAHHYVDTPRPDFTRWAGDVLRVAQRIAAVIADDLPACVDLMRSTERDLSGFAGPALVERSRAVAGLLSFWVSPASIELRMRAGMITPA